MYYQTMKGKKRPYGPAILSLGLFLGILALSALLAPPASADIYRWEDESGVIHFTDDLSSIPAKYRKKAHEILKTPPAAGQPSLSPMGGPSIAAASVLAKVTRDRLMLEYHRRYPE
ncbi:MAG TPA: DUF4124 domain-containing protein, partial [Desulfobacteria bacterium]|nr:DUF4124 domain-containing protein [Desulfobacteria bacterium]